MNALVGIRDAIRRDPSWLQNQEKVVAFETRLLSIIEHSFFFTKDSQSWKDHLATYLELMDVCLKYVRFDQ